MIRIALFSGFWRRFKYFRIMRDNHKTLQWEMVGNVCVCHFNRPDAANALNVDMALDIKHFFDDIAISHVRAVLLTGRGKHFCAGADLKERKDISDETWQHQHHAFEAASRAIMHCHIPVIAVVNGAAFGGGLELALACDFIYASQTARFALTEAKLGIMPGLGGTQLLPRAIGMARAKELLFLGRPFSAAEALHWGMVNSVCTPEMLLGDAIACATTITHNAPLAIKAIKQSVGEGSALALSAALQCELTHYNTLLPTKDRYEGINAFNEKRSAVFNGE
jgi:enoyl-CoA hydratase